MATYDHDVQRGDIAAVSGKFHWRLENFSKLNKMYFSDIFLIGGRRWRLMIHPKGEGASEDSFFICLCAVGFTDFPYADFTLAVTSQIDNKNAIRKGANFQFTAQDRSQGFAFCIPLDELNDPQKGYIVNDVVILEAEVSMPEVATYQRLNSLEAQTGNSMDLEQSVGLLAEAVASAQDIMYPVVTPTETTESVEVVEAVAEVAVSDAAKKDKLPGSGELYEEGIHRQSIVDEKYEDVGGFSVLKTQASFYRNIWLSYGHIASSQVLIDLYSIQVAVVSKIMTSIMDMDRCHPKDVSSELIDSWEKKIKASEKLEFNIGWLRDRFEDIKKNFACEKKLQATLMEQVQAEEHVAKAERQLVLAHDGLKMARQRGFALDTKISPLLMERQNFEEKCRGGLLLLGSSLSPVMLVEEPTDNNNSMTVPVQEPIDHNHSKTVASTVDKDAKPAEEATDNNSKTVPMEKDAMAVEEPTSKTLPPSTMEEDAIQVEEAINNNNSKTVPVKKATDNNSIPCTGTSVASIPQRTETLSSRSISEKRKSSGDGGVVGGRSDKKPKISTDGCVAVTSQSITDNCPMPSRSVSPDITSSAPTAKQVFTKKEIMAVLLERPEIKSSELSDVFRSRLRTKEDKFAFSQIMKEISWVGRMKSGKRVVLIKE